MKVGDWLVHERTGDTFKVAKIWGDCVLVDNYIDAGDVHLIFECRAATSAEIEQELERRNTMNKERLYNIMELNDLGKYGEQAQGVINELAKEIERLKDI